MNLADPPAAPTTNGLPEARLLVVDDEPNIVELLSASLRFSGFEVHTAANGTQALQQVATTAPDLVVLDVMMPGLDGFEVVRRMRQEGHHCPVLFLTARDAVEDRVAGLTLGADDYVTKPFSLGEVLARIRAILRRAGLAPQSGSERMVFADIELDEDAHEVFKAGQSVDLSPDGVQAPALPDGQPGPGDVQGADPGPRVALRLRW